MAPIDHAAARQTGSLCLETRLGKRRWRTSLTTAGVINTATSSKQTTTTRGTTSRSSNMGTRAERMPCSPMASSQDSRD